MGFIELLWLLIWGGMFSGIYNLMSPRLLSNPFAFFQGARALLPVLAGYICCLWILAKKSRFPFLGTPPGFLFFYCMIGVISSIFLSPDKLTAFYWAAIYLAPLLVLWVGKDNVKFLVHLKRIIFTNYFIFLLITVGLLPEAFRFDRSRDVRFNTYDLPFNLGEITANGVGRFALVAVIISFVRLFTGQKRLRFLWSVILLPSLYLLAQSQSRTALMGLAIASVLLVLLKGLDLRLLLVGPIAAYIIWISGVQWRSHGDIERIMFLSGRQYTWQKGLAMIKQSPFLGWGFHADRIMLNSEHMHNSYLHAAIHGGIIGATLFLIALFSFWVVVMRSGLIKQVRNIQGTDQALLTESILITGFLTARSFFESTGAFYGVDLLLLLPAMTYVYLWACEHAKGDPR